MSEVDIQGEATYYINDLKIDGKFINQWFKDISFLIPSGALVEIKVKITPQGPDWHKCSCGAGPFGIHSTWCELVPKL